MKWAPRILALSFISTLAYGMDVPLDLRIVQENEPIRLAEAKNPLDKKSERRVKKESAFTKIKEAKLNIVSDTHTKIINRFLDRAP